MRTLINPDHRGDDRENSSASSAADKPDEHCDASSSSWLVRANVTMAIFTGLLAVISAYQGYVLSRQGIDAHNDQVLSHPPDLVANEFQVHDAADRNWTSDASLSTPLNIRPGQQLKGTIYVINAGNTEATIERSCWREWWPRNLPMSRPKYTACDEVGGKQLISGREKTVVKKIAPGDFGRFDVDITTPNDYDAAAGFYLIGVVTYRPYLEGGLIPPLRHMMFARKYTPAVGIFVSVGDRAEFNGNE